MLNVMPLNVVGKLFVMLNVMPLNVVGKLFVNFSIFMVCQEMDTQIKRNICI